jgi:hypothetical protein
MHGTEWHQLEPLHCDTLREKKRLSHQSLEMQIVHIYFREMSNARRFPAKSTSFCKHILDTPAALFI